MVSGDPTANVKGRKRNLRFISNIYVVKNTANPETQGKVFLWNYGSKVFDKIKAIMESTDPDVPGVNPFDLWNGRNFNLKIATVAGYANYDGSTFAANSSALLNGDDAALEALWKTEYSLAAFTNADQFKSYDELNSKFRGVLGSPTATTKTVAETIAPVSRATVTKASPSSPVTNNNDDDDGVLDALRRQMETE